MAFFSSLKTRKRHNKYPIGLLKAEKTSRRGSNCGLAIATLFFIFLIALDVCGALPVPQLVYGASVADSFTSGTILGKRQAEAMPSLAANRRGKVVKIKIISKAIEKIV